MHKFKTGITMLLLVLGTSAGAGDEGYGHGKDEYGQRGHAPRHAMFDYARVVRVEPLYRQVRSTRPVRECEKVPIYHARSRSRGSASGMLAGGLIGDIIGHQVGSGRERRVATAVGTLIGAQSGRDAIDDHEHDSHGRGEVVGYEEHCEIRREASYEEVQDGYDVTYKYRGRYYNLHMPYDPGKRIKMRIQITPVI